ncbi:MAG TPA: potassium channel family protein [Anaeromyxobacter sp.]|nr:potassium channel family protein [Anaeromyxobacter sp.]
MAVPEPHASAASPAPRRRGESDAVLSVFLLLLLAGTVMAWPLRDTRAEPVLAVLRLLTLAVGIAAIAPGRAHAIVATLVALVVGYAQVVSGDRSPLLLAARLVFFSLLGAALLVHVFRPGRVTMHRVLGAVSLYVLLGVVWGTGYQLVVVLQPGAIHGPSGPATVDEAMWLSFITLTTTGYGDVLPASALARSLAVLEALVGVLYPAILIGRLVSLLQGPSAAGAAPGATAADP